MEDEVTVCSRNDNDLHVRPEQSTLQLEIFWKVQKSHKEFRRYHYDSKLEPWGFWRKILNSTTASERDLPLGRGDWLGALTLWGPPSWTLKIFVKSFLCQLIFNCNLKNKQTNEQTNKKALNHWNGKRLLLWLCFTPPPPPPVTVYSNRRLASR